MDKNLNLIDKIDYDLNKNDWMFPYGVRYANIISSENDIILKFQDASNGLLNENMHTFNLIFTYKNGKLSIKELPLEAKRWYVFKETPSFLKVALPRRFVKKSDTISLYEGVQLRIQKIIDEK